MSIQRDEFAIDITSAQQPDLHDIPAFYQVRAGNFWVADVGDRVVGTISLLDIGNQQGALRKMFVHRSALPPAFPIMAVDTRFFQRRVEGAP